MVGAVVLCGVVDGVWWSVVWWVVGARCMVGGWWPNRMVWCVVCVVRRLAVQIGGRWPSRTLWCMVCVACSVWRVHVVCVVIADARTTCWPCTDRADRAD